MRNCLHLENHSLKKKNQGNKYCLFRGHKPLGRGPLLGCSPFRTRPRKWQVSMCACAGPHAPATSVGTRSPTNASSWSTYLPPTQMKLCVRAYLSLTQSHPLFPPLCQTANLERLGNAGVIVISLFLLTIYGSILAEKLIKY